MKMLLGLVLRDKHADKYNIFAFIEDVKRMPRNLRFCVDNLKNHLMHVEDHIPCNYDGGEQFDPSKSNAHVLVNISSSKND